MKFCCLRVDLHCVQAHCKKVTLIEWHPTAASILLSAGMDFQCILWNTDTATALSVIAVHRDVIYALSWNRDGSLFATSCKDKLLRVIDPRTGNIVAVRKSFLFVSVFFCWSW